MTLKRKTPLKRTAWPKNNRKPMNRVSRARASERRAYAIRREQYLIDHPLCQAYMARFGIDERLAVAELREKQEEGMRITTLFYKGRSIPPSMEIHHRNKSNGERLLNESYWMAVCDWEHAMIERTKDVSRDLGLLCPINARPDGSLPDGSRCLTTAELIDCRARKIERTTT